MFRTWHRMVVLGVFLIALSATVQAVGKTIPTEQENNDSPLYEARLDATLSEWESGNDSRGALAQANYGSSDGDMIMPSLNWPSFCIGSGCLGSFCLGSGCVVSYCLISVCRNSDCLGSGCFRPCPEPPDPIEDSGPTFNPNDCNQP